MTSKHFFCFSLSVLSCCIILSWYAKWLLGNVLSVVSMDIYSLNRVHFMINCHQIAAVDTFLGSNFFTAHQLLKNIHSGRKTNWASYILSWNGMEIWLLNFFSAHLLLLRLQSISLDLICISLWIKNESVLTDRLQEHLISNLFFISFRNYVVSHKQNLVWNFIFLM